MAKEITLKNVSKSFNEKKLFSNVNLDISQGVYCIIGENGIGKTTLMKIMMGLILPDDGVVELFDESTEIISDQTKRRIGFVMASERSLYYKLTASENLFYIGRIYGLKKVRLNELIPKLLYELGIEDSKKYVETYSTGMKKKLMIARSLLCDPDILFYDEIYSGLDSDSCLKLKEMIKKIGIDKTIVIITHQQEMLDKNCKKILIKDGSVNVLDH